jgi:hypothetical protein
MFPARLPDPTRIEEAAKAILASGEFARSTKGEQSSFRWLLDILRDFFEWAGGLHGASPLLFWIVLIGCLLILGAIMAHALVVLLRALQISRATYVAHRQANAQILTAARLLELAGRQQAQGNLVAAIRTYYHAAIVALHERRALRLESSQTPREILGALQRAPAFSPSFRRMLDVYEPCVFGHTPADAGLVEVCATIAREFTSHQHGQD